MEERFQDIRKRKEFGASENKKKTTTNTPLSNSKNMLDARAPKTHEQ